MDSNGLQRTSANSQRSAERVDNRNAGIDASEPILELIIPTPDDIVCTVTHNGGGAEQCGGRARRASFKTLGGAHLTLNTSERDPKPSSTLSNSSACYAGCNDYGRRQRGF